MNSSLGLNRTSDAGMALAISGEVVLAIQKERISRVKHAWGHLDDVPKYYLPDLLEHHEAPTVIVECFSSDRERDHLSTYRKQLGSLFPQSKVVEISHHLAHVYGAFHPSPFDEAAVLVVDHQGSPASLLTDTGPIDKAASHDARLECISHYAARRQEQPRLIHKQLWPRPEVPIDGLGAFYTALTQAIVPGLGKEGIVMGLSALGDPDELSLPPLEVDGGEVHVPEPWMRALSRTDCRFLANGRGRFDDAVALAAAGQRAFEDALLAIARWLGRTSGLDQLVFTGGCALNCAANQRLVNEAGFARVWIPPAPHDGGTALGCALYGQEMLGHSIEFRWISDSLGPVHDIEATVDEAGADDQLVVTTPPDLGHAVAQALAQGDLACVFDGGSESGPRALGNRSILGDPRYEVTRDVINRVVKARQWFRPLAPMVQAEHQDRWFTNPRHSPFMQYAVGVTDEARRKIPAVIHHDETARIQTVRAEDQPFVWEIIEAFRQRTGVGVLLNTSFNGPGQPIVETPTEALELFRSSELRWLVMPPYLIRKRIAPHHPYHS